MSLMKLIGKNTVLMMKMISGHMRKIEISIWLSKSLMRANRKKLLGKSKKSKKMRTYSRLYFVIWLLEIKVWLINFQREKTSSQKGRR